MQGQTSEVLGSSRCRRIWGSELIMIAMRLVQVMTLSNDNANGDNTITTVTIL